LTIFCYRNVWYVYYAFYYGTWDYRNLWYAFEYLIKYWKATKRSATTTYSFYTILISLVTLLILRSLLTLLSLLSSFRYGFEPWEFTRIIPCPLFDMAAQPYQHPTSTLLTILILILMVHDNNAYYNTIDIMKGVRLSLGRPHASFAKDTYIT
jgi:hypothetical protein